MCYIWSSDYFNEQHLKSSWVIASPNLIFYSMATISQGILGPFSGKVGTVVGAVWKGIATIRSYNPNVTNSNTPAQQEQRAKFSLMVAFLRPFLSLINIGFGLKAIKQTAFNAAMKCNMVNAITGVYPAISVDYSKVLLGEGNLPAALNPSAVSVLANKIDFTWEDNSEESGANLLDKVVLSIYHPVLKKAISVIGETTRTAGTQTVTVPDSWGGANVQTYIGFTNAGKDEVSNIEFLAAVLVA